MNKVEFNFLQQIPYSPGSSVPFFSPNPYSYQFGVVRAVEFYRLLAVHQNCHRRAMLCNGKQTEQTFELLLLFTYALHSNIYIYT